MVSENERETLNERQFQQRKILDIEEWKKMLNGYYMLSFRYSEGFPPLQVAYNFLFSRWLGAHYHLDYLKPTDIQAIIEPAQPPKRHLAIDVSAKDRANKIAVASLVSTLNVHLLGRPSIYEPLKDDPAYAKAQEFNSYHPHLAEKAFQEDGEEGVLENVVLLLTSKDLHWILFGRPNAPGEEAKESFLRKYILFCDVHNARHPFFHALFHRLRKKILYDDFAYEDTVKHLAEIAGKWQEAHPGSSFYPPNWPPTMG
jgi:hypothetical protein